MEKLADQLRMLVSKHESEMEEKVLLVFNKYRIFNKGSDGGTGISVYSKNLKKENIIELGRDVDGAFFYNNNLYDYTNSAFWLNPRDYNLHNTLKNELVSVPEFEKANIKETHIYNNKIYARLNCDDCTGRVIDLFSGMIINGDTGSKETLFVLDDRLCSSTHHKVYDVFTNDSILLLEDILTDSIRLFSQKKKKYMLIEHSICDYTLYSLPDDIQYPYDFPTDERMIKKNKIGDYEHINGLCLYDEILYYYDNGCEIYDLFNKKNSVNFNYPKDKSGGITALVVVPKRIIVDKLE